MTSALSQPHHLNVHNSETWTSLNNPKITDDLETITVVNNTITSIGRSLQQLIALKHLDLSGNKNFQLNAQDVQHLQNNALETFSCADCGIRTLATNSFSNLPKLKSITLSKYLRTIPSDLFDANTMLRTVVLSDNVNFSFIPNTAIVRSKSISTFIADRCNVTAIYAETFAQMTNLEVLHLNENKLLTIDAATNVFVHQTKLVRLELKENKLKEFPVRILRDRMVKITFCLDGNPLIASENNNLVYKMFLELMPFNSIDCGQRYMSSFIEWMPPEEKGISDLYIASYITVIMIVQGVLVTLLVLYLLKITYRSGEMETQFDYAAGVLNDHDIYSVYDQK